MTARQFQPWLAAIFVFLWPVALVGIVGQAGTGRYSAARMMASSIAFILLTSILRFVPRPHLPRLPKAVMARQGVLAGASFLAIIALLSRPPPKPEALTDLTVLVAAFAEEYVFRWLLPTCLQSLLSQGGISRTASWPAARLIAQASFALCHFSLITRRVHDWGNIGRIFVGGLLYANIVTRFGIGLTSGIHGSMNYTLMNSPALLDHSLPNWGVVAAGMFSATALWLQTQSATPIERGGRAKPSTGKEQK